MVILFDKFNPSVEQSFKTLIVSPSVAAATASSSVTYKVSPILASFSASANAADGIKHTNIIAIIKIANNFFIKLSPLKSFSQIIVPLSPGINSNLAIPLLPK